MTDSPILHTVPFIPALGARGHLAGVTLRDLARMAKAALDAIEAANPGAFARASGTSFPISYAVESAVVAERTGFTEQYVRLLEFLGEQLGFWKLDDADRAASLVTIRDGARGNIECRAPRWTEAS